MQKILIFGFKKYAANALLKDLSKIHNYEIAGLSCHKIISPRFSKIDLLKDSSILIQNLNNT